MNSSLAELRRQTLLEEQFHASGDSEAGYPLSSVCVDREKLFWFELWVIGEHLLLQCPISRAIQDLLNGYPVRADAGFPEPYVGVKRDPVEERVARCGHAA